TGAHAVTCINIYHYPSDTVYSILRAIAALKGDEATLSIPGRAKPLHILATKKASQEILATYKDTIGNLYRHYRDYVFDERTGLIDATIHLSGTKDITQRSCSFYDNVIFWKTTKLAGELGVIPKDTKFLNDLKSRIIETFWQPDRGYFLEDLSEEGRAGSYYSSDWLIVLSTGFISPENPEERDYFVKGISYIKHTKLDMPLPLKYQHEVRAHRQFFVV